MTIGPITQPAYPPKNNSTSADHENERLSNLFLDEEVSEVERACAIKPLLGEHPLQLLTIAAAKLQLTLRRPHWQDADHIKRNLYSGILAFEKNLREEELDSLISDGTYTHKKHVHEMTLLEDESHDVIGAIHFETIVEGAKRGLAHIHSLDVLPNYQRRGAGTLLLSSALEAIHAKGGDKVTLKTTYKGIFLYAAFCFQPKKPAELTPERWMQLPYASKVKILARYWEVTPGRLRLNLTSERVKEAVAERFRALFTSREKKPAINVSEISLPEETFSWGILQDTRNDSQTSK
ncbi:GNAT family N-acetyltransferase [Estrella lausannensis]|uniref:Putative-related N-acetyltransferase family protein n=1 Tax=Estrella lausannensis TaxID=483423 RepID=A0A0H5DP71_9BACT|nr:GNAT family N-acetyltransferase [Estrella lausannensis]CRX38301.1 putative-related N-acetyltransferase family protein [Estrella lausannensis]